MSDWQKVLLSATLLLAVCCFERGWSMPNKRVVEEDSPSWRHSFFDRGWSMPNKRVVEEDIRSWPQILHNYFTNNKPPALLELGPGMPALDDEDWTYTTMLFGTDGPVCPQKDGPRIKLYRTEQFTDPNILKLVGRKDNETVRFHDLRAADHEYFVQYWSFFDDISKWPPTRMDSVTDQYRNVEVDGDVVRVHSWGEIHNLRCSNFVEQLISTGKATCKFEMASREKERRSYSVGRLLSTKPGTPVNFFCNHGVGGYPVTLESVDAINCTHPEKLPFPVPEHVLNKYMGRCGELTFVTVE